MEVNLCLRECLKNQFALQIDAKYPCGSGGWIHYRITNKEHLDDIMKLLELK